MQLVSTIHIPIFSAWGHSRWFGTVGVQGCKTSRTVAVLGSWYGSHAGGVLSNILLACGTQINVVLSGMFP